MEINWFLARFQNIKAFTFYTNRYYNISDVKWRFEYEKFK